MRVEVFIHGLIEGEFIQQRVDFRLKDGATVKTLKAEINKETGLDITRLSGSATVMLAGRVLELPSDLTVELSDGDVLTVLSPLAGGS